MSYWVLSHFNLFPVWINRQSINKNNFLEDRHNHFHFDINSLNLTTFFLYFCFSNELIHAVWISNYKIPTLLSRSYCNVNVCLSSAFLPDAGVFPDGLTPHSSNPLHFGYVLPPSWSVNKTRCSMMLLLSAPSHDCHRLCLGEICSRPLHPTADTLTKRISLRGEILPCL